MLLALASLLTLAGLGYSHEQLDLGGAGNPCGLLGARLAAWSIGTLGLAAVLVPALALVLAILLATDRGNDKPGSTLALRLTGCLLLLPAAAGLLHLLPTGVGRGLLERWDQVQLDGLGGRCGWLLSGAPAYDPATAAPVQSGGLLRRHLATTGSAVVLAAAVAICLCLLQLDLRRRTVQVAQRLREGTTAVRRRLAAGSDPGVSRSLTVPDAPLPVVEEREATTSSIAEISQRIQRASTTASAIDASDLVERIRARRLALDRSEAESDRSTADTDHAELGDQAEVGVGPDADDAQEDAEPATPPRRTTAAAQDRSAVLDSSNPAPPAKPVAPPTKPAKSAKPRKAAGQEGYHLPPIDLLASAPLRDTGAHQAEIDAVSRTIESLFRDFNINVKVVAFARGPTITQYEIELLDAGMRVNKVAGFEKDLSLKLGTDGIRIVAPLPNKKTIGVEVPNRVKMAVVMRDLVDEVDPESMALPVIIGRDVVGKPMVGDLAKMPHLLIAGATGTGKSVCLNAMISSILLFRSPAEVKFIMVDPKMVELAGYDGIPHLLTPPITDMTRAHAALEWLCATMDERFAALRLCGCRDIHAYNKLTAEDVRRRLQQKGVEGDEPALPEKMPFIIAVVDEYADLMMVNKEVEKSLVRLTAKARACGIHVVLATQRPSADVVTGLIKSNLPARICCRVADKNNSRVVLDAGGAENLLGRGDMLYLMPGTSNLLRGQGVWVQDAEIEAIIEHARSQGAPEYDDSITTGAVAMAGGGAGSGSAKDGDAWTTDAEFHAAVWAMFKYDRTGADFLRRKINVGYNKATKYIEWLEDLGFLSEAKGSRPREFIRSWDDWLDELKAREVAIDPEQFDYYRNPFA